MVPSADETVGDATYRTLIDMGVRLQSDIDEHLERWPIENGTLLRDNLPQPVRSAIDQLVNRAHEWFNRVLVSVLEQTTFDRPYINLLLIRVSAAIACKKFYQEWYVYPSSIYDDKGSPIYLANGRMEHNVERRVAVSDAREEAANVMGTALRLVGTALPAPERIPAQTPTTSYVPNTALILMWMDKKRPELVEVHKAVKEVFKEFGIIALRADDVEHQGSISDLVLEHIKRSEHLFADLSENRPNVYYEVGYAHALNKHPILYCRAGTSLHFDLAGFNVPEYENVTEFRRLLRTRLEAITGRTPNK